jgi:DNA processing protein
VARQFAQSLAESGVTVVSGLAKGIDTEAHRGVLDVPAAIPLAVVGSGLNVCYPAQNTALWKQVAVHGAVVSEYDDNAPAAPWQFPRRNRIIAALADVVCVIESHERGGALSTVAEALRRGRTVMAVPGSIRSAASLGTNRLIADGAIPALDPSDVFLALGMSTRFEQQLLPVSQESDPALIDVLSALGEFGAPIDEVLVQIGGTVGQRQAQLQTLESQGKVANIDGWWTPL